MTKVLIVEDDHFLLSAYKFKFEKMNYELKLANNGKEALEVLNTWKPDVIVLDLIMPDMDGYDFLKRVKNDTRLDGVLIMVASNLGQKEDRDKAIELGAKAFIIKGNLSLTELTLKLDQLIKENSVR